MALVLGIYAKDRPLFDRLKQLPKETLLTTPVHMLPFGSRALWAFRAVGASTVGEAIQRREWDYLLIPNVGRTTTAQMKLYFEELGLALNGPDEAADTASEIQSLLLEQASVVRKLDEITKELRRHIDKEATNAL